MRGGLPHIWRVDLDGSNLKQLTFGDTGGDTRGYDRASLTPDGEWVIFNSYGSAGKHTPWKVSVNGGEPVRLSDRQLVCNAVSPDGQLIACYDAFQQQGSWKIVLLPVAGGD